MKNIKADIAAGSFKRIYLFYGDEVYLLRKYVAALKKAVLAGDDSNMNFACYDGHNYDLNELKDSIITLPFFAERRLIIIEEGGLFGSDSGFDEFVDMIPDSTVVLMVERSVDKKTKLYKKIAKDGYAAEFKLREPAEAAEFAASYLNRAGKVITQGTCRNFVASVGCDLYTVTSELEKLISYAGERSEITDADVEAICSVRIENHIFDIVDALMSGKIKTALKIYFDLIALKEEPLRLLSYITGQYDRMLVIKDSINNGMSDYEIASATHMGDWLVRKYRTSLKNCSYDKIRHSLELCIDTEEGIKTGDISQLTGVEILLANLSML